MGAIDQTLFDSNITNTLTAAEDLKNALGKFPSPAESGASQETANAAASARDVVYKVDRFADHKTPGTIDQASFDAEMKILLGAKDSLQAAEDALQDSYTDFTSAANLMISDIEALASFMTEPPEVTRVVKKAPSKDKMSRSDHDRFEKEMDKANLEEMAMAKAGKSRFPGFGRRR